jgi:hypothetical protein
MHRRTRMSLVHSVTGWPRVIEPPPGLPAFRSDDGTDLVCGNCDFVVAERVSLASAWAGYDQARSLIVICPKCRSYNVLPT